MNKRYIAFLVSLTLILQCITIPLVVETKAQGNTSYAVALPVIQSADFQEGVLTSQKLSNFTAKFDYTASESDEFKLLYNYDSTFKKVVYSEDFEKYDGDFEVKDFQGHGFCASVREWETYNIAEIENDFSFTAFMALQNRDWGQMKIYLKEDLYLSLKGQKHENPMQLHLINRDSVIHSFDLNTIADNLHMIDGGSYIKVTVEGAIVKVALSTDSTVSDDEIVFTAELPADNFTVKNSISIWQGNTGLYFDDVTIIDLTKSGYETEVNETYTYKEIYSENFDSDSATAPENAALADDGNGGKMLHSAHWVGEAVICNLSKNYTLEFSASSKSLDWDNKFITLGNGIELHISGKMITSDGLYTLRLLKDGNEIAKDTSGKYACEANNNFRIVYNNGLIEVYVSSSNKFIEPALTATVDTSADSSAKSFKVYGGENLYIDNISVKDLDDYTVDVNTKTIGKYGAVQLKDGKISVLEVNGSTETEKASANFSAVSGKTYRFAISRDKDKVSVSVDEKTVLTADVRYDSENYMGDVVMNASADISNIDVYDSGRITFTNGEAILNPYALSTEILALAKSTNENTLKFENNIISADITDVNGAVNSSAWLNEEAGDMVIEFDIISNRSDWVEDRFYFSVSGDINPTSGENYQWEPEKLYKNGYSLTFGAELEDTLYYNSNSLADGVVKRLSSDNASISEYWGNTTKKVRIVRKVGEIKVYLYNADEQPVLIEKITDTDYLKGNIYWYHRQGSSQISNISVFDTENYEIIIEDDSEGGDTSSDATSSDNTSSDDTSSDDTSSDNTSSDDNSSDDEIKDDGKTELLKFYNTTKTNEKLFVNKPAVYEIEGPWYKITNPHANAMYLEKSFIDDVKVSDMDMFFTYYASGYWMTNEFYFGSTDNKGNNGYVLRIKGEGTTGDSNYNVELLKKNNGEYEQLETANISNITNGAYCFHITVKDGDITVNIRAKNAKEEDAYILKGESNGVYGGIYMYMYDDSTVRLRDIVIYKGTDIENAEKPDLSVEKETLLDTDFSDGKAPVELFSKEDTGVTLELAEEKLHFNTNDNNYMQVGGFAKDDWLEDFTAEFDYLGHRGDWNINRFGWHTERKDGDLYSSVYLSILGSEIAKEKNHKDNYAKVKDANIQLISSQFGVKKCIGYATIPEINEGSEYTLRIAVNGGNITIWVWEKGEDMPEKATIEAFEPHPTLSYGDFFVHAWSSNFSLDNMLMLNYADYSLVNDDTSSDNTSSDDNSSDDNTSDDEIKDDGKTELLKFYNTEKTDEKLFVNKPAVYEIEGPWYKITNPHANAMYLEKSFIDDVKVSDMDMFFTYYASGYWMTNEFYFGSTDNKGNNGYVLRIKGEGTTGDSNYNVELLKKNNGEYEQLETANISNITNGAYCFHITVKDGDITVNIRAKNAKEEDAYILKGESNGVYGGIYMYMYDDSTVRLRDIVIYKGTDIENAEKPDLSVEKETLLDTDFSDGKAPVELFSKEDTGVTLELAEEKLHFNTNDNNYMQVGGFAKDDWLEDFTAEFDYLGHRGDWNINRFGWHTERKDGDLYSSVYLSILGSEIAKEKNHKDNYAKVKDANIQLISSQFGVKKCIGYATIPEINEGSEYTLRIAVNGGNITIWVWEKGEDMPEKATIEAFEPHPTLSYGDFFVHAWCSTFSLDNMLMLNYADYSSVNNNTSSEDTSSDDASDEINDDGKTELLKFYNTTKTNEKLFVNKPAVYEIEGPWYKITNPHANAMYLEKSFIDDVKVSDMDMSFTYYASGYWMTNEFYFGSTDNKGNNGYVLRIKGEGTTGDSNYNVELLKKNNGEYEQLETANISNITNGAYCFHITVKDGDITVNIRAKNAKEEDAYILKGESNGVYGGIYMYMYDDSTVRLRDIVIYKGTDIENAEKPDLSVEKETLLDTDFSDGKAPVELFSKEDTGVTLELADEKLHFDTNDNNYMQIGGFAKDDWLEDFTAEFDYLGHRGDWNINRFGWHTERKDGDLYSSVYLSILGSEIAKDKNHVDNYAKVKDANIQLISSQFGVKKCIGYATIPEINEGSEYTLRIAVNGGNITIWVWEKGEDMPEKATIEAFEPHPTLSYGDFFVHAWSSNFSLDNMLMLNYADYSSVNNNTSSEDTSSNDASDEINDDGKTELLKFYNTTKTNEKLFVNKPAVYEIEGPWYKITNPHANAMYLEKSFIDDVKVSDMDMSFTYYASGYWMTNEFYFGSTDNKGNNGYVLRIRGDGPIGKDDHNIELLYKGELLSTAMIPNITDGAYCFHITVKDGDITVNIRAKNAKEEDAYILKGESNGVYGGIYMYMYDDSTVRLRDIVIYKGTDIENAEKPDLSVEKETLLDTDFSDGKAPVELFSKEDTGVTLELADEKLHFDTNDNNYMQIGGFAKDDWLEDFTAEFDYLGHRGDWNINRFGWHTERKDGDLYSSVYLSILGSEIAKDKNHVDNYAKVKDANIQLISSQFGVKKCIGYATIPEINEGSEYTLRIAVNGGNITIWVWEKGEDMPEKATIEAFEPHPTLSYGDFFVHAWCSTFSLDNMKIVNYADYLPSKGNGTVENKIPEFDGKTELLKFYNTVKTKEKLVVNDPAVYEIEGPWYKITNPHANAMYLEKSFIDDVKVSDMDMSFTYYASGYWMTNEFFFGSTDKYGRNGFILRMRGDGTAGDSGYNVELLMNDNGRHKQLSTANIPNLTDGAYCFHITIKDGNIIINIRAKNAKVEDAYILKGESDGVYGGIYMYMYDDSTVRLRDIVIYKGTDIENAEKPDLSIKKETLLETDFSDGKAPVELFDDKKTGVSLSVDAESQKLHFNTNHNNYMQIGGFVKDDWLEDFTAEFDYLGYRGDWNIDRFGWHTERKDGDLYSSVYLSVLGNEIANDTKHVDNYAKVEGANVQLISSRFGIKKCIGYASIPEINDGREYTLRIAVDGGNISVWAWATDNDMPEKSVIKAFEPHPTLSYGDFFVHAWCSDFALDNMKIVNFADYGIYEPITNLHKEIGEIFRVDRIFEKIKEEAQKDDTTPVVVEKKQLSARLIIIPVAVMTLASMVFFIVFIIKRRKKLK